MTNLILSLFVTNHTDVTSPAVRDKVGKTASVVGILLNLLLAAFKVTVGALFGAISVLADGLNNLTDCGSNVVSFISFKLSGKPADSDHPYGHRRAEYVAGLVVGFLILTVAVELVIESVGKILQPQSTLFSWVTVIALSVSVLVKLWMFVFNRKLGTRYNSELLTANATDSISDACATFVVLLSVLVAKWTGFDRIDGIMGVAVAAVIAFAGIKIVKDTASRLLGEAPSAQTVTDIVERIKGFDGVLGIHDLNVHSYGADSYYASVHVEVDSAADVMESHDMIDRIERDFELNTNVHLVIHMDPVVVGDPELDCFRAEVEQIVRSLDESFSVHDFRMVRGSTHINLIFDVATSFNTKLTATQVTEYIRTEVNKLHTDVFVVPTVERQLSPKSHD